MTAESEGAVPYRVEQFLTVASILSSLTLRFNPVGFRFRLGLYDARFGARRGCGEALVLKPGAPKSIELGV